MQKLVLLCIVLFVISCSKEGVGGNGKIKGFVSKEIVNQNDVGVDTVPASSKNVFIIYGDESYFNDKVVADVDGYFEFDFLKKGDYTIYSNSDCASCSSGKETVTKSVEIESKDDVESVMLLVRKKVDYDDGTSVIKGRLMVQEYVGTFPVKAPYVSQENEVYIAYGTDKVYFDRMDTDHDGNFEFRDLIKGTYTLYAYSECDGCTNVWDTVSYAITIGSNYQELDGGDLTIEAH